MADPRNARDREQGAPERNPLGLGARDAGDAHTGSTVDTSYDAQGSDPYRTGEPRKDAASGAGDDPGRSVPADPDVPSSDEP